MKDPERVKNLKDFHSRLPDRLVDVSKSYNLELGKTKNQTLIEVWGSKYFSVLVFRNNEGIERMNVHRVDTDENGSWKENITWDELMELKRQCGRGEKQGLEPFPKDSDIINTNNVRHLVIIEDESLLAGVISQKEPRY